MCRMHGHPDAAPANGQPQPHAYRYNGSVSVKRCCAAKMHLHSIIAGPTLCIAATAVLDRVAAFLDVSSLNLAVLRHRLFFRSGDRT